jgi:class 3 adenylate cyclase
VTLGAVARFATLAELAARTGATVDLNRIERALDRALAQGMVLTEGPVFLVARIHALVAWLLGRLDDADARYRKAIDTAEQLGMAPELALAHKGHAQVLESLEKPEAARAAADRAAALSGRIGRPDGLGAVAGREGTVVIMFTDVVGSTRLTEALGDVAYRGRADALDLRLRTAVRERGGRPEEGITLGDGIVALFGSARGAIECAVGAHSIAGENGLDLRVGLHAGDVSRSASGTYGGALNVTSRVCDLADAGETLVSETVRGLARTSADVGFADRGLHELKGIGEPVHVYAVTAQ